MNQLKAGVIFSYIIIIVNIIIGIVYTPFMLRMLGQDEYGLYSLASSVIAYLTVLDLGFANAIVRYTAKFRAEEKLQQQYEMFGMFLRLYSFIGLVALIIGFILMFNVNSMFGHAMNAEELNIMRVILILMSFNLAVTFPLSIYGAIITAYENFIFQKIVNLIRIMLNPAVMIILLFFGYKAIAMVVVTTIFNIVTLLINCWYCHRKLGIKIVFGPLNFSFLKEISIYSFWIFLNVVIDRLYWSTGQFILGIYKGVAAVAVFAVAIQLKNLYFMFSTAISGIYLPKITTMIANNATDKEISNLFIRTGRIQFIVMSYIVSGFILLGNPFIRIWAGEDYSQAYIITLILFIATFVPMIQNIGITILQARNQMKFRVIVYLVISIASVVISIPFAENYGGVGCAIAIAIAMIMGQGVVINIYYAKKVNLDIIKFWGEILKMSILPAILITIGILIKDRYEINSLHDFLISALIFSLIYIPLFWLLSMNKYERKLLSNPVITLFNKLSKL